MAGTVCLDLYSSAILCKRKHRCETGFLENYLRCLRRINLLRNPHSERKGKFFQCVLFMSELQRRLSKKSVQKKELHILIVLTQTKGTHLLNIFPQIRHSALSTALQPPFSTRSPPPAETPDNHGVLFNIRRLPKLPCDRESEQEFSRGY